MRNGYLPPYVLLPELIKKEVSIAISNALQSLLNQKHLYQKLDLDSNIKSLNSMSQLSLLSKEVPCRNKVLSDSCYKVIASDWNLTVSKPQDIDFAKLNELKIPLPTIKIYCGVCKCKEPFHPIVYNQPNSILKYDNAENGTYQIFILEYECQRCQKYQTIFMVRRDGLKLSLTGRSPMEIVLVPKTINNSKSKYFSDAIIANNSGQTLAGLFLLRVFIEQYVRETTNDKDSTDITILLEGYMKLLPTDFKSKFPSLSKIYSDLSAAIHEANASTELFNTAKAELIKHFEARKTFDL